MMKTLVVILCLTIGLNYAMWVSKLRGRWSRTRQSRNFKINGSLCFRPFAVSELKLHEVGKNFPDCPKLWVYLRIFCFLSIDVAITISLFTSSDLLIKRMQVSLQVGSKVKFVKITHVSQTVARSK